MARSSLAFDGNHLRLNQPVTASGGATPLLLLHGASAGAWVWQAGVTARLTEQGFSSACFTFGRRGGVAGLTDFMAETMAAIAALDRPVVLVAHSLGGLVAQRLLDQRRVLGAVLLAPVPPEGLWWSSLRLAMTDPLLWGSLARLSEATAARGLSRALLPGLTMAEAAAHLGRLGQESRIAVLEAQAAQPVAPYALHRKPVLVLGGEEDPLILPDALRRCAAWHGTTAEFLPRMGHLLMLDRGWEQVVDAFGDWLRSMSRNAR